MIFKSILVLVRGYFDIPSVLSSHKQRKLSRYREITKDEQGVSGAT